MVCCLCCQKSYTPRLYKRGDAMEADLGLILKGVIFSQEQVWVNPFVL